MSKTGRNEPCPCGSGKKYKQCCALAEKQSSQWLARAALAGFVAVVAVGLLFVFQATRQEAPEPYEYDAATNRYWDPEHAHWHEGAPPAGQETTTTGQTPAPWTYDPASDKHWNPEHGHWHDGRPPLDLEAAASAPLEATAPPQPDLEPWEYDPIADRHWNPETRQWADGPPVSAE